jgi:5'-nucleotidase (lipoprotein e(P4) family)
MAQSVPGHRLLVAQEPTPNLGQLKTKLITYHDCQRPRGCYVPELNRQSNLAIAYLQRRVAKAIPGEKLALVLDIDETALSNWAEETEDDFGFIPDNWNIWVEKKQATPIAGTLRLFNEALKHKVAVFFVTGRSSAQEPATVENLKAAGYRDWTGLSLRGPHPSGQTTREYKSGERRRIVEAGYRIILNVGDQMSDLTGSPQAELSVKLPNPFYYIP